jgi:ArsR family transcriptional regulator, arsenate/arsenite/antimonite-responsive transcriptional repressor / arsenate reductase (thioredoxin)
MPNREYNVLFLCTGNSARSIMAECAINRWGKGRFKGFSAGSCPRGSVHPLTLELLSHLGYDIKGLRSKSWEEFARPGAPPLDFVFTVRDRAAGEQCPAWPGQPVTGHWGVADPVTFEGTEDDQRRRFAMSYRAVENRIKLFTQLKIEALDRLALQRRIKQIGETKLPDTPES